MTTQTLTLTDFLLARIAEDEAVAQAATSGPWHANPGGYVELNPFLEDETYNMVADTANQNDGKDAAHIARHDPARVLAECEAKRRIVEDFIGLSTARTGPLVKVRDHATYWLQMLALPYADHPDYREEWKP